MRRFPEVVNVVGFDAAVHQHKKASSVSKDIGFGQMLDIIIADSVNIAVISHIVLGFVTPDLAFFIDSFENAVFQLFYLIL